MEPTSDTPITDTPLPEETPPTNGATVADVQQVIERVSARRRDTRELFRRFEDNPILTACDWPDMVNAVFNPAAVMFGGETLLLVRVEDRSGLSRLTVARSENGYTGWTVDSHRTMAPNLASWAEHWGIEDPRITGIDGRYYVVYTGYSMAGPLVCMEIGRAHV